MRALNRRPVHEREGERGRERERERERERDRQRALLQSNRHGAGSRHRTCVGDGLAGLRAVVLKLLKDAALSGIHIGGEAVQDALGVDDGPNKLVPCSLATLLLLPAHSQKAA